MVVLPLFSTWIEFKPAFTEDCMTKGLLENKKLLEQKVEETKALMQMRDIPLRENVSYN